MFFGSHEGASRAAILYSIAISCRLNGINLFEYICDVIEKTVEWQPNTVSDVIALKRNGEVSVHYVDSIGFKDLQGFLDKQPERPSVLMNLKEKCDAPECNPTVCRKARDEHEL